jgi:RNA-directed DNA polymerase
MHDPEKSDSGIIATKLTNKAGRPVAEPVERRPGTKGNADQQSTHRTQGRARVIQALSRVRKAARQRKKERFTALLHHINVDTLRTAFYALKRKAAPGVDGMTWQDYEADLERSIKDLHERVRRGAYRPQPSRRAYIDKADGTQRPLAIAALEDKLVQGATVMVLNAIYEGDFVGFSYGFRPGRGPHDALDALSTAIKVRKVNWILDADIRNFFGAVSQEWLVRFLEHRIGDKRIVRLIQRWLKAGILEDGVVTVDDRGTGQGSVISPILANIYLHYCFDLWAERWRRQEVRGDMIVVRYADDLVVGFEHVGDARRFLDAMHDRLGKFALSLHPDKTRLIEFGRFAATDRKQRGLGKPETFAFLGFTFICGRSRLGNFQLQRKTRRDRMRRKLRELKLELRRRMHHPIPEQGSWLRQVVAGHFAYYAVPTNSRALSAFRHYVTDLWRRSLRRRSQKDGFTWERMSKLAADWLPPPRILHPWPDVRFDVKHPR